MRVDPVTIPGTSTPTHTASGYNPAYLQWLGQQPDVSGKGLFSDALSSPVLPIFLAMAGIPEFGGAETGGASMPPAIPEPDPTFGGALSQTAPGVFGAAAAGADTLSATAGPAAGGSTFSAPDLADPIFGGPAFGGSSAFGSSEVLAPGDYNVGTSMTAAGAGYGMDASNPLDWIKQLSKTASPYLNLASAGIGLLNAGRAGRDSVYDPFASQRGQYQQQLSRLSSDPNYLTQLPGYQAGLEATRRGMAAGGYNISGNEQAALFNYGGNVYNQEATRLAGLAGANVGPMGSDAGRLRSELISRSLASLGYAARSFGGA